MKWITAGDLDTWPEKLEKHCQTKFPELIRKLVNAETHKLGRSMFDFPAGDCTSYPEWDGKLRTSLKTSPYIAEGTSGWEMGTDEEIRAKANEDIGKREKEPLGLKKRYTTFTFATPRKWSKRNSWVRDQKKKKVWKNIVCLDASLIEQWLDTQPGIAKWLAIELKKIPDNILGIEEWWSIWASATAPSFTSDLVIAGREADVETVQSWLKNSDPQIHELYAESPEESIAFLHAAIDKLPEDVKRLIQSRTVVVKDPLQIHSCVTTFETPLIFFAPPECRDVAGEAKSKGHTVILTSTTLSSNCYQLAKPQSIAIAKNLVLNGKPRKEAETLAINCGRRISTLHRLIHQVPGSPTWANATNAQILIPALLAGGWNENKPGDVEIIESLTQKKYSTYKRELEKLLHEPDSPIRRVNNIWAVQSPYDLWNVISPYINDDYRLPFEQAITTVLSEEDPKFKLQPKERYMAPILGMETSYSKYLRLGLAHSAVLWAVRGEICPQITNPQATVDQMVSKIFSTSRSFNFLASMNDLMPLLSEASPLQFLSFLEGLLTSHPEEVKKLLTDEEGFLFKSNNSNNILWALEKCAWHPFYFARTAYILLSLAALDATIEIPSSGPIDKLKRIFIPGCPQTYASAIDRITVLSKIAMSNPEIAWEIVKGSISIRMLSDGSQFRWRDSGGLRDPLKPEDRSKEQQYNVGLNLLIQLLLKSKQNLLSVMQGFLHNQVFQQPAIQALEQLEPKDFSEDEIEVLLHSLREALNWLNSYAKDDVLTRWIKPLSKALSKFTPDNIFKKHKWLFDNMSPAHPEGEAKTWQEAEAQTDKARKLAMDEILAKFSLSETVTHGISTRDPRVFGYYLGKAVDNDKDIVCLTEISKYTGRPAIVRGYAQGRVEKEGSNWVKLAIKSLRTNKVHEPIIEAHLHFGLPECKQTWDSIKNTGPEAHNIYWQFATGRASSDNDKVIAIEQLLSAKRSLDALDLAATPGLSVPSLLLQGVIMKYSESLKSSKIIDQNTAYRLAQVFKKLYSQETLAIKDMVKLELPFGAILADLKKMSHTSFGIHKALKDDANTFASIVSAAYPNKSHDPLSEEEINTQKAAMHLLDSLKSIPGSTENGEIDIQILQAWIRDVQRLCTETNHSRGYEIALGTLLSYSPADPDDQLWPHKAVREVLEEINSPEIEEIIVREYCNRDTIQLRETDNGQREKSISEEYEKKCAIVGARWPRTAVIFTLIAQRYSAHSSWAKSRSQLDDLGF